MKVFGAGLIVLSTAITACAEGADDFVTANLASVLYHELGHAVIDQLQLPIFGQEEDAADVLSVLLINRMYDEETAQAVAYDAAFGFSAEASDVEQPVFWDTHGPDEQRYFNLICLFYGANVDARHDLAQELMLPNERALSCEEEFVIAEDSWGPVLDEMGDLQGKLVFQGSSDGFMSAFLQDEVSALNDRYRFPIDIPVALESCGEANAYYDLDAQKITICQEFEDHLRGQFDRF